MITPNYKINSKCEVCGEVRTWLTNVNEHYPAGDGKYICDVCLGVLGYESDPQKEDA